MKNLQKLRSTIKLLFLPLIFVNLYAQDVTTVEASNDEISQNLDLEAVASIFADSKDLEAFEYALNDPQTQISNLDLDGDNQVDYLRVMESVENNTHVVVMQAVLGEDLYQDVATIEVEKDSDGEPSVQFVGDVYLYGPNYIIEPVYVYRPAIFSVFWRPYYRPYRSVFYWGYYPKHWHYWRPHRVHHYTRHVHVHVNVKHRYHRTHIRKSVAAVHLHKSVRRNDFAKIHPSRSYTARKTSVKTSNGTQYRTAGLNQSDGDKYRAASVKKPNGTTKKVAGVNKANGTTKRVASVEKPNGSKKTVAVKKNPNGSAKAVSVTKKADGTRTVKTAKKSAKGKKSSKRKSKTTKG
ncbi:MAG: hypothetical protein ABF295_02085 [Flavobacteriaceae bacterium]